MATEIQGSLVLNEISEDGGSTWKVIVCEDTSQISFTTTTNETRTKTCGVFTGTTVNAAQVTGSGVAAGDLSGTQVSFLRMAQLAYASTLIKFRRKNSASGTLSEGEITYAAFDGYVTEATETSAEGDITKFNWAIASTGTVDLTPGS